MAIGHTELGRGENNTDQGAHAKHATIDPVTNKVSVAGGEFIADADILRDGQDLILQAPNGETIIIDNYFLADPPPMIQSTSGTALTPEMVQSFVQSAGPVQHAQNGTLDDASPVGIVQELSGKATVTRTDGSTETLNIGSPIYQGDIVETADAGAVNLLFIDETTMAISNNARLAIDEYVFDPASESGTTNMSILRGVFVFTSGLIGREDPDDVEINTPMGSIGIRGTIIMGDVDSGQITVMEGAIVLRDFSGNEMTLANQFETAQFSPESGSINYLGETSTTDLNTTYTNISTVSPDLFSGLAPNNEPISEPMIAADEPAPDQQMESAAAGGPTGDPLQEPVLQGEPTLDGQPLKGEPVLLDGQKPLDGQPLLEGDPTLDPKLDGQQTLDGQPAPDGQIINDGALLDDPNLTLDGGSEFTGDGSSFTGDPILDGSGGTLGSSFTGDPLAPPPPPPTNTSGSTTTTTGTTTQNPPPPIDLFIKNTGVDDSTQVGEFVAIITNTAGLQGLNYTLQGITTTANATFNLVKLADGNAGLRLATGSLNVSDTVDFKVTATALDGRQVTEGFRLDVITINDKPIVDLDTGSAAINTAASFTEDSVPVDITPNAVNITDQDGTNLLTEAIVKIGNLGNAGDEFLDATLYGGVTKSYDSATGELHLTGSTTLANYISIFESVTYDNASDNPNTTPRIISFKVSDGTAWSNIATSTVSVAPVNDAPTMAVVSPTLTAVNEDDTNPGGDTVGSFVGTITDPDSPIGGIAVTYADTTNGTWEYSINGGASWTTMPAGVSAGQALLLRATDMVRFVPDPNYYGSGAGTIDYLAWDQSVGTAGGNYDTTTTPTAFSAAGSPDTATVDVNPVSNDAPVLDLDGGGAPGDYTTGYTEDAAAINIVNTGGITLTDADGAGTIISQAVLQFSVDPQDAHFEELIYAPTNSITASAYDYINGTLTLNGTGSSTLADFIAALSNVTYVNHSDVPNTTQREIQIKVQDSTGLWSNVASSYIDITENPNDADALLYNPATIPGINQINGDGGDDTFIAYNGDGNDTISMGGGDDTVYAADGDGNDTIYGDGQNSAAGDIYDLTGLSAGTVTYNFYGGYIEIVSNAGTDTVYGFETFNSSSNVLDFSPAAFSVVDITTGTVNDDGVGNSYDINGTINTINGSDGVDSIYTSGGTNIYAAMGNDEIFLNANGITNTIRGGSEYDTLFLEAGGVTDLRGSATGSLFENFEMIDMGTNGGAALAQTLKIDWADINSLLASSDQDLLTIAGQADDLVLIESGMIGAPTYPDPAGGPDSFQALTGRTSLGLDVSLNFHKFDAGSGDELWLDKNLLGNGQIIFGTNFVVDGQSGESRLANPDEIGADSTYSAANQTLVGDYIGNINEHFYDQGHSNVSMFGLDGDDTFHVSNSSTKVIDGGLGTNDIIDATNGLDFRYFSAENIEAIDMNFTNETLTLDISDILNLMASSDTQTLTIDASGLIASDFTRLEILGTGGAGGYVDSATFETHIGADFASHTTNSGYEEYTFSGGTYTLRIDSLLFDDNGVAPAGYSHVQTAA